MLCAKRKLTGEIVTAYLASKAHGPFKCPDCGDEVILKTGRRTVNHFAHVNPLACRYAENESEEHRRCKMEIYGSLQRHTAVRNVALERPLGTNRPDVSANINGVPVAIEVQISSLSLETIQQRTMEYARKGIYVLWLLQWTPKLDARRYTPRLWEKWIHAAYFGRVYYWIEGLTVVSYHCHKFNS
jgi:competence protein CoiA